VYPFCTFFGGKGSVPFSASRAILRHARIVASPRSEYRGNRRCVGEKDAKRAISSISVHKAFVALHKLGGQLAALAGQIGLSPAARAKLRRVAAETEKAERDARVSEILGVERAQTRRDAQALIKDSKKQLEFRGRACVAARRFRTKRLQRFNPSPILSAIARRLNRLALA